MSGREEEEGGTGAGTELERVGEGWERGLREVSNSVITMFYLHIYTYTVYTYINVFIYINIIYIYLKSSI